MAEFDSSVEYLKARGSVILSFGCSLRLDSHSVPRALCRCARGSPQRFWLMNLPHCLGFCKHILSVYWSKFAPSKHEFTSFKKNFIGLTQNEVEIGKSRF